MVTRPVTNETALFRRCFQPQVSRGFPRETCQNLTFEAVCKDAVRGLVRTESGALAQVSAGRLAPWLAPIEGVDRTAVDAPPLARLWTLPAFARVTQLTLAAAQKKKPRIPMGVLTSKPVQVSPLSLGFPTLYTVLLANAGTSAELSALDGKGLDFKSDPSPMRNNRLLAVCLVTGNQPVAKCARPTLAGCLQN